MTPSKCRRQGREAYEEGASLDDNPYDIYLAGDHDDWYDGWMDRQIDDWNSVHDEKIEYCPCCGQEIKGD